jgi:hypothetical protein
MVLNKVKFEDIVNEIKEDAEINIYQLLFNLKCSKALIYSRITENGFKGLKDLKISILKGEI